MLILNNCETNKLEHIENNLAKTVGSVVSKCGDSDLLELYERLENDRIRDVGIINERMKTILEALKLKMGILKNRKMNEILDFYKFKMEMVEIQENIINLKKSSKLKLSDLKMVENDLNDELDLYYNKKVAEWGENLHLFHYEFVPPKVKSKNSRQCKEVQQFFDFIHQSGGHENGWRKDDHLLFVKLRAKYKKSDELFFQLHEILPDISVEEIKVHEQWYKKYMELLSKKKEAIDKWKQIKSKSNIDSSENIPQKSEANKALRDDNKKLRDKLAQWKSEKEERLLTEMEVEKQVALNQIEKERLKKQKQIETKKIVNEWRESKMLFEQSREYQKRLYEESEKRRRAANANKLIKQFQSMDKLHVLKMRRVHQKFTAEKRVPSGPTIARDPDRLMKPTAQWTQRVRSAREPMRGLLPIFATPKLGVPEWRKSIS